MTLATTRSLIELEMVIVRECPDREYLRLLLQIRVRVLPSWLVSVIKRSISLLQVAGYKWWAVPTLLGRHD